MNTIQVIKLTARMFEFVSPEVLPSNLVEVFLQKFIGYPCISW